MARMDFSKDELTMLLKILGNTIYTPWKREKISAEDGQEYEELYNRLLDKAIKINKAEKKAKEPIDEAVGVG